MVEIVEVAPNDDRLADVYPVMGELRTELSAAQLTERYRAGHPDGYRIAALYDEGECRAAVGYRIMTNLVRGRVLYVDDLVTRSQWRSNGYGKLLNDYVTRRASDEGCDHIALDSGTARARAHAFYFREGYTISSFHFGKPLA